MQVIPQENREFVVSVGPKGQITVPKAIRARLGVRPKDRVAVRLEQGEVSVKPVRVSLASIYQMGGTLKQPLTDKEIAQQAWEEHAQEVAGEGL